MEHTQNEIQIGLARQPSGQMAPQTFPWWGGVSQLPWEAALPNLHTEPVSNPHVMQLNLGKGQDFGQTASLDNQVLFSVTTKMPPLSQAGPTDAVFDERSVSPTLRFPREHLPPHTRLQLGHPMTHVPYDSYYGQIVTAFTVHPHMIEMQKSRMVLPSEMSEEPVLVNWKQFHGIVRRRQSRAKAESENKLVKRSKGYLHESRHLHAMRRVRGCGGRFLNTKDKESRNRNDGNRSSLSGVLLLSEDPPFTGIVEQVLPGSESLMSQTAPTTQEEMTQGDKPSAGAVQGNFYKHQPMHSSAFQPVSGASNGDGVSTSSRHHNIKLRS